MYGRLFYVFIVDLDTMKHIAALLILLSLPVYGYSQRAFFKVSGGYGLPLSNSTPVYLTGFPYTGGNTTPNDAGMYEVKKASMFSGVRASVAAGMMFSKLGFEVAAVTVPGEVSYKYSGSLGGVYAAGSNTTITQSAKSPLMIVPSLVMKVPGKKIDVVLRAGVVLPAGKKIFVESETIDGANRYFDRSELKTKFGIGFAFSGGVEYKITKKLRASACIDILTMTLKAKESNLVRSFINDNDVMSSKLAYEKSTRYVDDISGYAFDSSKPRQQLTYTVPFGTKGFSLGVGVQL